MDLRSRLDQARRRLDRTTLGRISQAALAAGLAWELALQIPGHKQPFFAPIAAVIALGAERGRRGRQAVELMLGVGLGIILGATIAATVGSGGWQIVIGVAVAFSVGTALGARPLTTNEAAVSAILVVGLHRPGSSFAYARLIDALIGGGIAIVTAQLLFPIDPLELVRDEAQRLAGQLADALDEVALALRERDRSRAVTALRHLDAIDDRGLYDAIVLARDVAHRAPRRRHALRQLGPLGELATSLAAAVGDSRALVTGALRAIDAEQPPPAEAAEAVAAIAEAIRTTDPTAAREAAERSVKLAEAALDRQNSLGLSVLSHAVGGIADDILGGARAREEGSQIPVSRIQALPFVVRGRQIWNWSRDERIRSRRS
jgi:uncharacterized membrane protein YgaE (UPF0421/DUF939 family)